VPFPQVLVTWASILPPEQLLWASIRTPLGEEWTPHRGQPQDPKWKVGGAGHDMNRLLTMEHSLEFQ